MKFPVLEPLRHNGQRYAPGADVELDETAEVALILRLVCDGVIRDVRPIMPPEGGQKNAAGGQAGAEGGAGGTGSTGSTGADSGASAGGASNPSGGAAPKPATKPAAKKAATKAKSK